MADIKGSHNDTEQPPSYFPAPSPGASSTPALHPSETTISPLPLALPSPDASAPEVRTYIRSYLYHNAVKYDLGPAITDANPTPNAVADVAAIAAKWRYGSGQELRSYDRQAWEGLFGVELGLVLSKHVEERITKEKVDEDNASYTANIVMMAASGAAMVAMFSLAALVDDEDARMAAFFFSGLISLLLLGLGVVMHACFLGAKIRYNRKNAIEMGVRKRGQYIQLPGDEDISELRRMDVV